jgi:hypothetical protein
MDYFRWGDANPSLAHTSLHRSLFRPNRPSKRACRVEIIGCLKYVAVRNRNHLLAVYRVRNDGALRRLKRWPVELAMSHSG